MPSLSFGKRLRDKLKQKRIPDPSSPPKAPWTSSAATSNLRSAILEASTSAPSSAAGGKFVALNASLTNSEPSCAGSASIGFASVTESHMVVSTPESPETPSSQAAALPSSLANPATTSSLSSLTSDASISTEIIKTDRSTPSVSDPTSPNANSKSIPLPSSTTATSRDLWTEALHKLSPEDQRAVDRLQPSADTQRPMSESIEELLGLTRNVQDECKAKSFKFRIRGKDIILRDIAGKIIFWLSKFKEVGDVAVNFDPMHASLPWAGVRFLLQAAIAEHEQMGDLVVATEKLSCLITRGAIFERLYPHGTLPADVLGSLHHALVELYMTALQMMALCHRLFVKNSVKRAVHAIFNPGDVSALLNQCEEREVQVEHEAHNCERTRSQEADAASKRLLEILREPILRTDEHVSSLLEKTEESERLEILDWISKVLYGSNHQTVKDERTTSTCEWLLSHCHYQEWQDTSASIILWLCGTAGTGKTFLTSKIIDEVQVALGSKPNQEGFAFFYCNRNEAERREPLSVLRAFIRQLSTTVSDEQSMQKLLKAYYIESRLKASQLNMKDCKSLLLEFINIYPRTTLILDALDECERHERLQLIEILDYLLAEASNPLKIFVSSRPDGDITEKLKDRANIQINAIDNQDDISRFVNSEIVKHRRWDKMAPKLQMQIVETLQQQSQGMFQWAYLQIKQLLDLQRPSEILDRLGKLPKDLQRAYDEIYNGMNEVEKEIADRAFQWVMCANEPLRTIELLPAICQDGNSNTIMPLDGLDEGLALEYCHNLLVVDPIRHVWVPSHLSVIEYFEKNLWSRSQANGLVANVCLLLLQNTVLYNRETSWGEQEDSKDEVEDPFSMNRREDFVPKQETELEDPLHGQGFELLSFYARRHWMIHAKNSADMDNHDRLSALLEEFLGLPLESSTAFQCWHRMVTEDGKHSAFPSYSIGPEELCPASIASFAYCAFGLDIVLPNWHDFNWIIEDMRTEQKHTYLELAARSGLTSTCRYLVKNGMKINAQSQSYMGSALATASLWGKIETVNFLVTEEGADVNMQLQFGYYGSALAAAAYGGKKGVVEFLLKEGGAEVNMQLQYGEYGSALVAAIYGREEEIVKFLVEEGGAEVNMQLQYGEYGSALVAAIYRGEEEIVKFLVKEGEADVSMLLKYGEYRSALDAANKSGATQIAQLLIEYGAREGIAEQD